MVNRWMNKARGFGKFIIIGILNYYFTEAGRVKITLCSLLVAVVVIVWGRKRWKETRTVILQGQSSSVNLGSDHLGWNPNSISIACSLESYLIFLSLCFHTNKMVIIIIFILWFCHEFSPKLSMENTEDDIWHGKH